MTSEDPDVTREGPFKTIREHWQRVAGLKGAARRDRSSPAGFVVDEEADEVIVMPRHDVMASASPDVIAVDEVLAVAPQLSPKR
jgi:hypothetical protein